LQPKKHRERANTLTILGLLAIGLLVWTILLSLVLWGYEAGKLRDSLDLPKGASREPGEENWQKLGLYWDNIQPKPTCAAYGTREYSARLMNVPSFSNGLKACNNMPVIIHGTTIDRPDRCEDQGFWAGMQGFWRVNFNETACMPMWGDFVDEGCVAEGSRLHRTASRLWNIQHLDDWLQMCSTTPADLHGGHFDGPKHCVNKGLWGIYGVWEYEDENC